MSPFFVLDFVPTARCGAQVRGPCPVHGSRTPRSRAFAAHLERHCGHCFGCGAGGNALDWWVAVTQLPLSEAALDLCRRLQLDVPRVPAGRRPSSRSPPGP
jgi:DNA primase